MSMVTAYCFFFFNDTATTEIYTLSLHDALPISAGVPLGWQGTGKTRPARIPTDYTQLDRKSTRLNSSHANISYAVFCLKKKKKRQRTDRQTYTEHNSTESTEAHT